MHDVSSGQARRTFHQGSNHLKCDRVCNRLVLELKHSGPGGIRSTSISTTHYLATIAWPRRSLGGDSFRTPALMKEPEPSLAITIEDVAKKLTCGCQMFCRVPFRESQFELCTPLRFSSRVHPGLSVDRVDSFWSCRGSGLQVRLKVPWVAHRWPWNLRAVVRFGVDSTSTLAQ